MNQSLDESNISIFLYLIEEYILLGFIQNEDFPMIVDLIQNKYSFADQEMNENIEEAIEIKTACLNLLITIILTLMGKNQTNFSIFEVNIITFVKNKYFFNRKSLFISLKIFIILILIKC